MNLVERKSGLLTNTMNCSVLRENSQETGLVPPKMVKQLIQMEQDQYMRLAEFLFDEDHFTVPIFNIVKLTESLHNLLKEMNVFQGCFQNGKM